MSLTLAARVSLVSCAVWLSLANMSSARLTPYSGEPSALLTFAASDADQAWLTRANPECQIAFRHAGEAVLAAENAFLRHLRNQEAAVLDAGDPTADDSVTTPDVATDESAANADDSTADDSTAEEWADESARPAATADQDETTLEADAASDSEAVAETIDNRPFPLVVLEDEPANAQTEAQIGLWRALNNTIWGSGDRDEPGILEQALQAVADLATEPADNNLLALADYNLLPPLTQKEDAASNDSSSDDLNDDSNSTEEEFVPAPDWNEAYVPPATTGEDADATEEETDEDDSPAADNLSQDLPQDQCLGDHLSAANDNGSSLRLAVLPSVTNEATIRSIMSSATADGLDRGILSAQVREAFTMPAAAPALELELALATPDELVANDPTDNDSTTAGPTTDAEGEAYDWQRYYSEEASNPAATPDTTATTEGDDESPKFRLEFELAE